MVPWRPLSTGLATQAEVAWGGTAKPKWLGSCGGVSGWGIMQCGPNGEVKRGQNAAALHMDGATLCPLPAPNGQPNDGVVAKDGGGPTLQIMAGAFAPYNVATTAGSLYLFSVFISIFSIF